MSVRTLVGAAKFRQQRGWCWFISEVHSKAMRCHTGVELYSRRHAEYVAHAMTAPRALRWWMSSRANRLFLMRSYFSREQGHGRNAFRGNSRLLVCGWGQVPESRVDSGDTC